MLLYINDLPDDIICDIAIYADNTTHYSKCDQTSDLRQQLELACELESDIRGTGVRSDFLTLILNKLSWFRLIGLIMVLLMWKWMGLFMIKNDLLRCWGSPSFLNWIRALILSLLLKLPPEKLELLLVLWSFFLLRLCKSTIRPCMEYCCHVWTGAPSCYLKLLGKLQKRICRTVGLLLAVSLESLAHHRNVTSLSLF